MISCREAVRRLWDHLENDLSDQDQDAVEEHLSFCRRCCGELEFADELRRVLTAAATVDLPADVQGRLVDVLDDLASGGPDPAPHHPAPAPPRGGAT